MNEIQLKLDANGRGSFFIENNGEIVAEMNIGIAHNVLTAYHTEVSDKLKGQGIGKMLLEAMVDHARTNHLKVIALCPFIYATFVRHPEQYADVWQKSIKE
jgi:predicted GNAT family acetyltransferase